MAFAVGVQRPAYCTADERPTRGGGQRHTRHPFAKAVGMKRIVMFGGGSGSRGITMALCRAGFDVTRVVPAWDSGGSSRELRLKLGMLAMGDIRQALMTLAHGENRVGSVVRFFNARLSEAADPSALRAEFDFYASGAHPLLGTMEPGIFGAILNYLRVFQASVGRDFDFCRGSIGNFVLTGAYLAHGRDVNTAIFVFRKLCTIDGNVWPSTIADAVELSAVLRNGTVIHGQDRVTALGAADAQCGIDSVQLSSANGPHSDSNLVTAPAANPAVFDAIAQANAIVFGPGSFFTSTLAHLCVDGVPQAIAATDPAVPKILVGNILECPETIGRTVADLAQAFERAAGRRLLTHLLVNRGWVPFERVVSGFRYLQEGPLTDAGWPAAAIAADDFEDPWTRGRHDADKVVSTIGAMLR